MVGTRVYIGGLPYGVKDRDIERFFKGYGRIRDILIKNGYGFVVSRNKQEQGNNTKMCFTKGGRSAGLLGVLERMIQNMFCYLPQPF